jgi:type IV secretion system protein VirD4
MSAIHTNSQLILGRKLDPVPKRPFGFTDHSTGASTDAERGLVTYGGDSHLMTFGSTGSGKTAGPVICNALAHPGQLIVFDCKGDVLAATARRRRELGQEVDVLDLRDGNCGQGSLNPLHLAQRCGGEIAVVARSYAAQVVARLGTERDPFWNDWAETMLTGGIAWLLTDRPAPEHNMSALFDLFNHEDPVYHIATLLDDKSAVQQRCARAAFVGLLSLPERETRPSGFAEFGTSTSRCFQATSRRGLNATRLAMSAI